MINKIFIILIAFLLCVFELSAQKLETQGGKDERSVSTKVKDGISSARVIIQSDIALSYNTNMGAISAEDIGSGMINGLNVDTLYFYLNPFDTHRRLIISADGYVAARIDLKLLPKTTYSFSVLEPSKFSDDFLLKEKKYEEGCRQYELKSWLSAINTFIPLAASGYFEAEEKLCMIFRDVRIREKLPSDIYSKFQTEVDNEKPYAQFIICTQYLDKYGLPIKKEKEVIETLTSAAIAGSSHAQVTLASCYQAGVGVELDNFEALKWYEVANTLDNSYAQINLATMYINGSGVIPDIQKSIVLMNQAISNGNEFAMEQMGTLYMNDYYGIKNGKEAIKWFTKAINAGCGRSWAFLGYVYMVGVDVPQDLKKSVECFSKGIELNDALSMVYMGLMYANGQGYKQDFNRAKNWYKKAADLGDRYGINNLAVCYYNEGEYSDAWYWFEKGGRNRNPISYHQMGKMSEERTAPERRKKSECIVWYEKAGKFGDKKSIKRLIEIYSEGIYDKKNTEEAFKWLIKDANLGDIQSILRVADAYLNGEGVETNELEAVKYLERAASLNSKDAMLTLAKLYIEGIGVFVDEVLAREWEIKAQKL